MQTYREAVGVYGLITRWNFPIAIPAWKLAPALAFGNSVVLKPANPTPATAHALVAVLHEAGLPAGVLNMVLGRGNVGDAIAKHPDVNGVSFTGSQGVGSKSIHWVQVPWVTHTSMWKSYRCVVRIFSRLPRRLISDAA